MFCAVVEGVWESNVENTQTYDRRTLIRLAATNAESVRVRQSGFPTRDTEPRIIHRGT